MTGINTYKIKFRQGGVARLVFRSATSSEGVGETKSRGALTRFYVAVVPYQRTSARHSAFLMIV